MPGSKPSGFLNGAMLVFIPEKSEIGGNNNCMSFASGCFVLSITRFMTIGTAQH